MINFQRVKNVGMKIENEVQIKSDLKNLHRVPIVIGTQRFTEVHREKNCETPLKLCVTPW
jgi:hypothetical protein